MDINIRIRIPWFIITKKKPDINYWYKWLDLVKLTGRFSIKHAICFVDHHGVLYVRYGIVHFCFLNNYFWLCKFIRMCRHFFLCLFTYSNKKLLHHAIWMHCKNAENFLKPLYDYALTILMLLRRLIGVKLVLFSLQTESSQELFLWNFCAH